MSNKLKLFLPMRGESSKKYFDRVTYAFQRRVNPSVKQRHHREMLVGPIGFWESLQKYQFGFLRKQGMERHHSVLDIGCGPLQGGLLSIDYLNPGGYVGIDVMSEPLEEGYKQILENGLVHKNARLIHTSSFGENELEPRDFDFFWASQMLYHLEPGILMSLLDAVSKRMGPTSVFYGDIDSKLEQLPDDDEPWREFKFYRHQPDWLREEAEQRGMRMEVMGPIGDFGYPKEIGLHNNLMLKFTRAE